MKSFTSKLSKLITASALLRAALEPGQQYSTNLG